MQKTLKRAITVILLLCVAFAFACFTACDFTQSPETPTNPSQQEQTENNDKNNGTNGSQNGETSNDANGNQSGDSQSGSEQSPKHTCSFVIEKTEEKYLKSAATCTEKAVYYKSCSCGEKGTETFEYGEAKGHSYTNYVSNNNATCESNATETATCDHGCRTSDTKTIENSALGHDLQKSETVTYCTIRKCQKYKCSRCTKETEEFTNAHITGDNLPDVHKSLSVGGTCEYCGGEVLAKNGDSLVIKLGDIYQVEHYSGTAVYFSDYASLINSAYISNKVTTIGSKAFKNYTALTSVTIPNSVTSIEDSAFYYCRLLTSVTIPNSVKSIGKYAFCYCDSLTSIEIPNSVTSIEDSAFYYCRLLTSVTIPNSVKSIGKYAFYYCDSLTSIEIPNSVTSIGNSAFYNCSSLTSVTIGENVTSIGDWAFYNCYKLVEVINKSNQHNGYLESYALKVKTSGESNIVKTEDGYLFYTYDRVNYLLGYVGNETNLTLPEKYNGQNYKIYKYAFYKCSSLKSITIPNSVTSIGGYAFDWCSSLTSVTIGNNVTSIGVYAFDWCGSLECINVDKDNENYSSVDGILYNKSQTEFIHIPKCIKGSVTIPDTITSIGEDAFSYCTSLTSITIPNSVTSLPSGLFNGCSSLEEMTIPFVGAKAGKASYDTYQYPFGYIFGESSYTGGTATTQYYYGSSTRYPTDTTYYIPSSLRKVTVTGGNILYGAFRNCSSLTSVTIGNSVKSVGDYAFYYCSSLTSVTIGNRVTSIGELAFSSCSSLVSVTIPDSVKSIGYGTFSGCSSLTSVTIPNSVTSIGELAFSSCSSLTSITIPNSVTSIGERAFSSCSSLTSVTIGNSVTSIGTCAFTSCYSLNKVNYTGTIDQWVQINFYNRYDNYIDSNPLYYARNLYINNELVTKANITTATKINAYAFTGCSSLVSVTIGNSVTSIGSCAFYDCSSLTSIEIPNSVTSIGSCAFYRCGSLTSVPIPNSVKSIGGSAFYECRSLENIYYNGDINDWVQIEGIDGLMGYGKSSKNLYINGKLLTEANITTAIKINSYAFYDCSSLKSVTIGNSVTSIGDYAFYDCSKLTEIKYNATECADLNDSSGSIFYDAGKDGDGIKLTIGKNVNRIPASLFRNASYITEVVFEEGSECKSIGDYAFYHCSSLTSIEIPNSVTSIGDSTFEYCRSLKSVYYSGTAAQWSNISIGSSNSKLTGAARYYYSETEPTDEGNYWHYDENGDITIW